MIRNEKCEVLDKQNFKPKYRMVYDINCHFNQVEFDRLLDQMEFDHLFDQVEFDVAKESNNISFHWLIFSGRALIKWWRTIKMKMKIGGIIMADNKTTKTCCRAAKKKSVFFAKTGICSFNLVFAKKKFVIFSALSVYFYSINIDLLSSKKYRFQSQYLKQRKYE